MRHRYRAVTGESGIQTLVTSDRCCGNSEGTKELKPPELAEGGPRSPIELAQNALLQGRSDETVANPGIGSGVEMGKTTADAVLHGQCAPGWRWRSLPISARFAFDTAERPISAPLRSF